MYVCRAGVCITIIVAAAVKVVASPNLLLARPVPNLEMPEKFMEGGTPQPATAGQNTLKDNMPLDTRTTAYVGRHSSLEKLGPADEDGHSDDLGNGELLKWVYGAEELKDAPAPVMRPTYRGTGSTSKGDSNGGIDPVPIPVVSTAVETGAFFADTSGDVTVDNNDAAIKPMSTEPGNQPSPPNAAQLPPPIMGDESGSKIAAFQFGEPDGDKPGRRRLR